MASAAQQGTVLGQDAAYLTSLGAGFYGLLYWDSTGATDGTSDYHLNSGGLAALTALAVAQDGTKRTANGTAYYLASDLSTQDQASGAVYCGTCWSVVVANHIEEHANDLH